MSIRYIIMCLLFSVVALWIGIWFLLRHELTIGLIAIGAACLHTFCAWDEFKQNETL